MSAQRSTLLKFATVCALIVAVGWSAPPTMPPWQVLAFAVPVMVLTEHGPEALTRLIQAVAKLVRRPRP